MEMKLSAVTGIVSVIGVVFLLIFVVVILSIILRLAASFLLAGLRPRRSWSARIAAPRICDGARELEKRWTDVADHDRTGHRLGASIHHRLPSDNPGRTGHQCHQQWLSRPSRVCFWSGLFSLFLSGYIPWIVAGIFVLPLFFTIAFSPWVLLTAWQQSTRPQFGR